jgi:carbonic anhydrase
MDVTQWSYKNYLRWKQKYPSCNGKKQSPINIDTSKISECNGLCSMSARYKPSSCNILNNNITPIINFDPGSFIKFKGILYELTKMTIHTPSMHTVNSAHYDIELLLYHCLNRSSCSDTGGVIISILLQSAEDDSGKLNAFLNEFINEIPIEESENELSVTVSPEWNPEILFPNIKSFFWYEGSLPTPPCTETWTYIVFEEIQAVSKTILDTLQLAFKDNIRPVRPMTEDRIVYYNNNTKFDDEDLYTAEKIDDEIKALQEKRNTIIANNKSITTTTIKPTAPPNLISNLNPWYVKNKGWIRGILITITLLIVILCSIKLTKYIVRSGFLVEFMQKAGENKKMADTERQIAESILAGNQGGNQGGYQGGNQGGYQGGNQGGNQGGYQGGNQGGMPPGGNMAGPIPLR